MADNFCRNVFTQENVRIFGRPVSSYMVVLALLYMVMSLIIIYFIKVQERYAKMGYDNAVKSVIFPIFVRVLWVNVAVNLYVGFIALTFSFQPVSVNNLKSAWAYAIMWTLQHFVIEGVAFILMKKGLGIHAAISALKTDAAWCLFTLLMQLLSQVTDNNILGFAFDMTWQSILLIFYGALWLAPENRLFRRPAAINYAKWWCLFRFFSMCSAVISLVLYTHDVGNCVYLFGILYPIAIFEPLLLYYTLLQDSYWWQGLDIGNGKNRNNQSQEIKSPLQGIEVGLGSAQSLAASLDTLAIRPGYGGNGNQDQGFRSGGVGNINGHSGSTAVRLLNFAYITMDKGTLLGSGSFSKVYAGSYRGKKCAIKLVFTLDLTQDIIQRVAAEAQILSSFRHPNVINILGVSVLPPSVCILLEFCAFGSLADVIKGTAGADIDLYGTTAHAGSRFFPTSSGVSGPDSHRPFHNNYSQHSLSSLQHATLPLNERSMQLCWADRLYLAVGCARGLAALHSFSPYICHRDIKSFNFLVDHQLNVKLSDLELGVSHELAAQSRKVIGSATADQKTAQLKLRRRPPHRGQRVARVGAVIADVMQWMSGGSDKRNNDTAKENQNENSSHNVDALGTLPSSNEGIVTPEKVSAPSQIVNRNSRSSSGNPVNHSPSSTADDTGDLEAGLPSSTSSPSSIIQASPLSAVDESTTTSSAQLEEKNKNEEKISAVEAGESKTSDNNGSNTHNNMQSNTDSVIAITTTTVADLNHGIGGPGNNIYNSARAKQFYHAGKSSFSISSAGNSVAGGTSVDGVGSIDKKSEDIDAIREELKAKRAKAMAASLAGKDGDSNKNGEFFADEFLANWSAPEVIREGVHVQSSDIYSLSLVLWEILAGVVPFSDIPRQDDIRVMVLMGQRPPIPEWCLEILNQHALLNSTPDCGSEGLSTSTETSGGNPHYINASSIPSAADSAASMLYAEGGGEGRNLSSGVSIDKETDSRSSSTNHGHGSSVSGSVASSSIYGRRIPSSQHIHNRATTAAIARLAPMLETYLNLIDRGWQTEAALRPTAGDMCVELESLWRICGQGLIPCTGILSGPVMDNIRESIIQKQTLVAAYHNRKSTIGAGFANFFSSAASVNSASNMSHNNSDNSSVTSCGATSVNGNNQAAANNLHHSSHSMLNASSVSGKSLQQTPADFEDQIDNPVLLSDNLLVGLHHLKSSPEEAATFRALDESPYATLLVTQETPHVIIHCTPAWEKMFRLASHQVIGRIFDKVDIHGAETDTVMRDMFFHSFQDLFYSSQHRPPMMSPFFSVAYAEQFHRQHTILTLYPKPNPIRILAGTDKGWHGPGIDEDSVDGGEGSLRGSFLQEASRSGMGAASALMDAAIGVLTLGGGKNESNNHVDSSVGKMAEKDTTKAPRHSERQSMRSSDLYPSPGALRPSLAPLQPTPCLFSLHAYPVYRRVVPASPAVPSNNDSPTTPTPASNSNGPSTAPPPSGISSGDTTINKTNEADNNSAPTPLSAPLNGDEVSDEVSIDSWNPSISRASSIRGSNANSVVARISSLIPGHQSYPLNNPSNTNSTRIKNTTSSSSQSSSVVMVAILFSQLKDLDPSAEAQHAAALEAAMAQAAMTKKARAAAHKATSQERNSKSKNNNNHRADSNGSSDSSSQNSSRMSSTSNVDSDIYEDLSSEVHNHTAEKNDRRRGSQRSVSLDGGVPSPLLTPLNNQQPEKEKGAKKHKSKENRYNMRSSLT